MHMPGIMADMVNSCWGKNAGFLTYSLVFEVTQMIWFGSAEAIINPIHNSLHVLLLSLRQRVLSGLLAFI